MGVADQGNIPGRTSKAHHNSRFGNQVIGPRANDVDTKNPIRLSMGQYLDETLRFIHALCPPKGGKIGPAHLIGHTGVL